MCHVIMRNIWSSEKGQMKNNDLQTTSQKTKD
jgi:hypothetical protein